METKMARLSQAELHVKFNGEIEALKEDLNVLKYHYDSLIGIVADSKLLQRTVFILESLSCLYSLREYVENGADLHTCQRLISDMVYVHRNNPENCCYARARWETKLAAIISLSCEIHGW